MRYGFVAILSFLFLLGCMQEAAESLRHPASQGALQTRSIVQTNAAVSGQQVAPEGFVDAAGVVPAAQPSAGVPVSLAQSIPAVGVIETVPEGNTAIPSVTTQAEVAVAGLVTDVAETPSCEPNPCINGGACEMRNSIVGGPLDTPTCTCPFGASGVKCEVDSCSSNGCKLPHGLCIRSSEPIVSGGTLRCQCDRGFTGVGCSTVDTSFCATSNPCQYGGTCISDATGGYACQCPAGLVGANCESAGNACAAGPCGIQGSCERISTLPGQNAPLNSYRCDCSLGFGGVPCSRNITACDPNPCKNGGTCSKLHCTYLEGQGGTFCDQPQAAQ